MNTIQLGFLLTLLAGVSTMLGLFPIFFKVTNTNQLIAGSLAFASGVMFCVSVADLLPESILLTKKYVPDFVTLLLVFLLMMIGAIVSSFIRKKVDQECHSSSLFKVGIISMIAIICHNLPEGMATFISTTKNTDLGISLAIAIALHNIPEGISISVPIYYSTKKKAKAFLYTLVSALSEPLGALITYFFLMSLINNLVLGLLFSLIAGMMISISFLELLPSSLEYSYPNLSKICFLGGILFMLFKFFF